MAPPTRYALSLPLPPSIPHSLDVAARAEKLGYENVWLADSGGPDPFVIAAVLAGRVAGTVGVGVSPAYTRTPVVFASMSASLAELMPGRFVLGLGCSSETIVDRWNGVPFERPLARVRETVQLVRTILSGEKTSFRGKAVRSEGFRLLMRRPEKPVPIYVGALRPPMLRVAGEVGDGVVVNLFPAEATPRMIAEIRAGAANAGRSTDDFEVVCRFQCWVTDDAKGAIGLVRRAMAGYFTTSVYNAFAEWCGFEREAREMREAWARRDREATERAFTDEMIDAIVIVGDAKTCRRKLDTFVAAGVTTPMLHAFAPNPDEAWKTIEALAPR
jgi:probable F420-dependent oxidoreductase